MKLVRLAYLDTNAVFESVGVELQSIAITILTCLEEVTTLARFSPFNIAFLRGAISGVEWCIEFSIRIVFSSDVAV